ncbi:sensor histidine kinase [Haliscomenobacter sp.]|uniref:sensor histidine kinase n=1 Tax=Haliscomenobacter sp. TaxID=2717303 RepID=UPI0035948738
MKRRYWSYLFIGLFCLFGTYVRSRILVGLPWYVYMLLFFIQFATILGIWELIIWVNRRLEVHFSLDKRPFVRILVPVLVSTTGISSVFLVTIRLFSSYFPRYANPEFLMVLGALAVASITLLNFIFFTFDFLKKLNLSQKEKATFELLAAQAEREKTLMQYHNLRNQVNPHFLFNTLTSLDGLVQQDPKLASRFIRHLAKVYRYVLEHKENEVVNLQTELNFIEHYSSLLNIRYGEALQIEIDISESAKDQGIVMVTLQMLIDNALKHNIVQIDRPLYISITCQKGYLEVKNNKQIRRQIESSNGQGLAQLQQLYQFLSEKPVQILDDDLFFKVQIPLL